MAAVNSRVQFLITAVDQTRAAFASVQRSMNSLRASVVGFKKILGFGLFGFTGAALVRDFTTVARATPEVSQALDNLTASYRELQKSLLDGGLNELIVDFANTVSRVFRGNNEILKEFQSVAFATGEAMDNLGLKSLGLGSAFTDLAANTVREFTTISRTMRQFLDMQDKSLFGPRSPLFTGAKGDMLSVATPADTTTISNTAAKADQLAFATTKVATSAKLARASFRELRQEIDPAQQAFLDLGDRFANVFSSVVSGAQSITEAVRDMANSILADLTRLAVNRLFQSLAASLFGGPTNIVPRGFAGGFATGGKIPSGMYGMVGERGPEFVTGPATVIPARGGGGETQVNIYNSSGAPVQTRKRQQGNVKITDIIIGEVKKAMGDGRFDGIMGQKFGMRPQLTSR